MIVSLKKCLFVLTTACLASTVLPAMGHHSTSVVFDSNDEFEVTGTVTDLVWKSPHARLYVDVVTDSGDVEHWDFELPSPNTMMRRGWTRKALQPGETVSVSGYRGRKIPTMGLAKRIADGNGKAMLTGATPDY